VGGKSIELICRLVSDSKTKFQRIRGSVPGRPTMLERRPLGPGNDLAVSPDPRLPRHLERVGKRQEGEEVGRAAPRSRTSPR
jgi:hypothetical protein